VMASLECDRRAYCRATTSETWKEGRFISHEKLRCDPGGLPRDRWATAGSEILLLCLDHSSRPYLVSTGATMLLSTG